MRLNQLAVERLAADAAAFVVDGIDIILTNHELAASDSEARALERQLYANFRPAIERLEVPEHAHSIAS